MKDFIFKLNVQPGIIAKYDREELYRRLIPNKISSTYNTIFNQTECSQDDMSFTVNRNYQELKDTEEFTDLISLTEKFILMYKEITKNYKNGSGINYSQDFLNFRDQLQEQRKQLIKTYSILAESNSFYDLETVNERIENEYNFEIDGEVGVGIDHIRRVQKLKMYIEYLLSQEETDINIRYIYNTELFIISDINQRMAVETSNEVERKINRNRDSVGQVNINPVYDELHLLDDGKISKMEIRIVYPNGDTNKELEILLDAARKTGAREIRTEFYASASTSKPEFLTKTSNLAKYPSERGYLIDIRSNNNSIIDPEKSIIKSRLINV